MDMFYLPTSLIIKSGLKDEQENEMIIEFLLWSLLVLRAFGVTKSTPIIYFTAHKKYFVLKTFIKNNFTGLEHMLLGL